MRDAITQMGWSMASLREKGLQLRGEYYYLDYKKAAVPEDNIVITTQIEGLSALQCAVRQSVATREGVELLRAKSAYCWRSKDGEATTGPEGWQVQSTYQTQTEKPNNP
jgi:acyl-CoA thioesterase FadM